MSNNEESIVRDLTKVKGISQLWDSQKKSIEAGLLAENRNFVIIAPTASGKTLNAEFAILQTLRRKGKCLYLVPLTSLQAQKGEELNYLHDIWDYQVSTKGDWRNSDVVVTTFELFYKAALRNPGIVENFETAIVDEFHILYDRNRGFNLEKAITLLKELRIRIICLSATFDDKEEIKGWLESELTVANKRAVPLTFGSIDLTGFGNISRKMARFYSVLLGSKEKHPILIFCSTRDKTRSRATSLSGFAKEIVADPTGLRGEMENSISRKVFTSLEEELYSCLCKRIAFHHSGLDRRLRELVEKKFECREVDFLFATTGLAYGINLPAKTVILCDLMMYGEQGPVDVPTYLFLQMAGRAGRPQFGDQGFAYVVVKTKSDIPRAEKLLTGKIEKARSHISVDDLFKKAILELIYSGKNQENQIISFFENTFFNYQSSYREGLIKFDLKNILQTKFKELMDQGFIEFLGASGFRLKDLGDVTMQFLFETFRTYSLDCFVRMSEYLDQQREVKADFDLIYTISKEFEGAKTYRITRKKSETIEDFYHNRGVAKTRHEEYSAYAIYYGWMENKPEYEIEEDFKVFASALKNATGEISKILDTYEKQARRKRLRIPADFQILKDRVYFGVRAEEIPFAKLKDIGRDTVRKLSYWCKAVLRRPPFRYQGDMLSVLMKFYEDKNRDDNFLLTTLANSIENIGPKRAGKIVDLVKSRIG